MSDSTALEPAGGTAINPTTGEVLELATAEPGDIRDAILEAREAESQLREFKGDLTRELLRRMDLEATWTMPLPDGGKISGDGKGKVEYVTELEQLIANLKVLIEEGVISTEAANEAVEAETDVRKLYKPRAGKLKKIKQLGARAKELIEACETPVPETARRVTISRPSTD